MTLKQLSLAKKSRKSIKRELTTINISLAIGRYGAIATNLGILMQV